MGSRDTKYLASGPGGGTLIRNATKRHWSHGKVMTLTNKTKKRHITADVPSVTCLRLPAPATETGVRLLSVRTWGLPSFPGRSGPWLTSPGRVFQQVPGSFLPLSRPQRVFQATKAKPSKPRLGRRTMLFGRSGPSFVLTLQKPLAILSSIQHRAAPIL